jgi:hypothetical protein
MPGTLLSNGAKSYLLISEGQSLRQTGLRLRVLIPGIARALSDLPPAESGKNVSFSPSPTLARTLQNVTTTSIAPFHGTMLPVFHQIIGFFILGAYQLQYDKVYGGVLLPAIIWRSFDHAQTALHRHRARPLVGNAFQIGSSAVPWIKCAFAALQP